MVEQISIYAENKKGAMSAITRVLAGAGINIRSFVTNDSAEFGIIRMLVSDPEAAGRLIGGAGYLIRRTAVIAAAVSDDPGSLDRLLQLIESANVNIDYLYTSFDRATAGPVIVLHADDMDEVEAFISSAGFRCL